MLFSLKKSINQKGNLVIKEKKEEKERKKGAKQASKVKLVKDKTRHSKNLKIKINNK